MVKNQEDGKVDPEREKLVSYVKKRLSKYNSWVAKTTKGKAYINCDYKGYEITEW